MVAKKTTRRRYAEGGKVEPKRTEVPTITERLKKAFSVERSPGIVGDAIKRRDERMSAMERGEPDPGQVRPKPDAMARGGRVKKRAR